MKQLGKIRSLILLVALVVMAQAPKALANIVLDLNNQNTLPNWIYHFPDASNPDVAGQVGAAALGDLLYKVNGDGKPTLEEGLLATSYSTSPSPWNVGEKVTPPPTYPIYINYDGGTIAQASYLLVKDGVSGSYLFNISEWDGVETIQIENMFTLLDKNHLGQPADITRTSHIEFYGTVTAVPEPATILAGALLLLPFGVSTIRVLRRNRAA